MKSILDFLKQNTSPKKTFTLPNITFPNIENLQKGFYIAGGVGIAMAAHVTKKVTPTVAIAAGTVFIIKKVSPYATQENLNRLLHHHNQQTIYDFA